MKLKTSELTGPALDWAVAKCEGYADISPLTTDGQRRLRTHNYSANWAKGGPIIEREGISSLYLYVTDDPFRWAATAKPTIQKVKPDSVYGPTMLIAAMRCYVASKMGEEIDVPDELILIGDEK